MDPFKLLLALAALAALACQAPICSASPAEVTPFIVGGGTALPGQFAYQVSVRRLIWFSWRHHCGGSLISKDWVLTTASCTHGAWCLTVAAGKIDVTVHEDSEQVLKVSKTVTHPNFVPGDALRSWWSDVALLRTRSPFTFSSFVRPARLPLIKYDAKGGALLATGWGVVAPGGWFGWGRRWASKLQVTMVQTAPCVDVTTDSDEGIGLCVVRGQSTPCEGDEGGALVQMLGDSTFTLIGLVTRTPDDCKNPKVPSAAVSVFSLNDFIQNTMQAN